MKKTFRLLVKTSGRGSRARYLRNAVRAHIATDENMSLCQRISEDEEWSIRERGLELDDDGTIQTYPVSLCGNCVRIYNRVRRQE